MKSRAPLTFVTVAGVLLAVTGAVTIVGDPASRVAAITGVVCGAVVAAYGGLRLLSDRVEGPTVFSVAGGAALVAAGGAVLTLLAFGAIPMSFEDEPGSGTLAMIVGPGLVAGGVLWLYNSHAGARGLDLGTPYFSEAHVRSVLAAEEGVPTPGAVPPRPLRRAERRFSSGGSVPDAVDRALPFGAPTQPLPRLGSTYQATAGGVARWAVLRPHHQLPCLVVVWPGSGPGGGLHAVAYALTDSGDPTPDACLDKVAAALGPGWAVASSTVRSAVR